MPTAVGPNTKGEENLVFSYDLGDVSNSYKGEPAFNAAHSLSDWSVYRSTLTSTTEIKPPVKGATVYVLERTDINSGVLVRDASPTYGGGDNNDLVGLGDGNWKYSIWVKGHSQGDSSTSFQIDIGDRNNNGLSITPTTPWTRVTTTDAAGINSSNYEFCDFSIGGTLNNKIYVSAVTISSGSQSHPQWLPSKATRSATEGLKDLTGNSTIDLTNVSFDSDAQMTFDGTTDFASLGTVPLTAGASTYTIEAVFKANSYATQVIWEQNHGTVTQHRRACMILLSTGTGGFNGQSNDFQSAVSYSTGVWYHWVITVDKNASSNPIKVYVNGTLDSQGDTSAGASNLNVSTAGAAIGHKVNNGTESFNGDIKLVKVYNRVLTASEAKSNFNAIKGRFNI